MKSILHWSHESCKSCRLELCALCIILALVETPRKIVMYSIGSSLWQCNGCSYLWMQKRAWLFIKQSWFWSLTFSAEKRLTDRVPSRTLPTKLKFSALSTSLQPVPLSLHWTFAIHSLNGTHMTNQSTPLSSLLRLLPEVLISPNPAGPSDIIPKDIWHHSEFWSVKSSFHFMTLTTPYVQASRDYDSRDFLERFWEARWKQIKP